MNQNSIIMIAQNKRILGILGVAVLLLAVPLIAMQFTSEVNWELNDFLIAGALLIGTGLLVEYVNRKVSNKGNRTVFIIVIVALLLLVWAELAVGIFGTPLAGS